jgi:hypothetical protein
MSFIAKVAEYDRYQAMILANSFGMQATSLG